MKMPTSDAPQCCLYGPADGNEFPSDGAPIDKFIAAVHHSDLCCGAGYDEAESHGDEECDCQTPSRGLYVLDLERSIRDGARWVYVYEREVLGC